MRQQGRRVFFVILFATSGAIGQTAVTNNNDGSSGAVPIYSGSASLDNSPISVSGSNVGIGTTAPSKQLQTTGAALFGSDGVLINGTPSYGISYLGDGVNYVRSVYGGGLRLGTYQAPDAVAIEQGTGYVGIGTTEPSAQLTVSAGGLGTSEGNSLPLLNLVNTDANWSSLNVSQIRNANGDDWLSSTTRIQQWIDAIPQGYIDFNPAGGLYALAFGVSPSQYNSAGGEFVRILNNGNFGIGTTSPAAKLEVDGNVKLTSGSGASITYSDGTLQSTAWTGTTCGGDYAESVDVSGDRAHYEPGDVLVADPSAPGRFLKSAESYSTLVAGIYSTKPGLVGRRQTTDPKLSTTEIPMAMVGIVPTKVSAENGPVKVGDLLVTSSTLGYAMRGTERGLMLGAVVGKALAPLDSGAGVIEVLVTLQ